MFDSTAEIELKARTAEGIKTLEMRWPTDEEWIARAKGRKILVTNLGRGVRETSIEPGESDLKLYEKIKLNGAPPISAAEATRVVEQLAVCDVVDVVIEGDDAIVKMVVMAGQSVEHHCHIPTAEQVQKFRRSAFRLLELPFNRQQMTMSPDAGARLWDDCKGTSADYTGKVPAPHKDAAIRAVIEFLDRELGPKPHDETF